ncbi:FAD binding domain-containing protein [Chloroflexota bacterium]
MTHLGRKRGEHFNAETIDGAVSLLGEYMEEARIIAGGVDLVSLMKNRVVTPRVLVNIKTIPDLAYIREDAEGVEIGTLATINEIETSGIIRGKYPMLAEAAHSVAAPQIRNMATIGGNLCQQVRCWYYRRSPVTGRTFFCRRKGGKHCYADTGENTHHAIFNRKVCAAVCPSDLTPALVVLEAKVKIASPDGERVVSIEDFYTSLGNILEPDDMITEIQIPTPRPGTKQRFLKFRLRKAIDFAISSVAAAITIESGVVSDARIALGGVAPIPYRALRAEEVLKGEMITESVAETSAKVAVSNAVPLSLNSHKVTITKALVKRAVVNC